MGSAVVTGASSGLGWELAKHLAQRGERVVAVARNQGALNDLVSTSTRIEGVVADLSTTEGRARLFEAVADVDILVNNAGFGSAGVFAATPADVSDRMLEVNVAALTALTAHWLPGMVERKAGRVLNVASTAAFQPGPNMAVYYASKAYVLSFTEAIAEELRGTGVTATAFCPGSFASGFQATAGTEESRLVKGRSLPTSADMAVAALEAMDKGKVVAIPGVFNKVGAAGPRFTPRPVMRRVVGWIQSDA